MSPAFLDDCARFVRGLEAAQQTLLETLRLKRRALVTADAAALQQLNEAAGLAAKQLQGLNVRRDELLKASGIDQARTLTEVLLTSVDPLAEALRGRLSAVQQRFGELRREAWIQWIVAQRSGAYLNDLLDVIATGGQLPPGYQDPTQPAATQGGAVLDAAA